MKRKTKAGSASWWSIGLVLSITAGCSPHDDAGASRRTPDPCLQAEPVPSAAGRCAADRRAVFRRAVNLREEHGAWFALGEVRGGTAFVAEDGSDLLIFHNGASFLSRHQGRPVRVVDATVHAGAAAYGGADDRGGLVIVLERNATVRTGGAVQGLARLPDGGLVAGLGGDGNVSEFCRVELPQACDPLPFPVGLADCGRPFGFSESGLAMECVDTEAGVTVLALGPGPEGVRRIANVSCWATGLAGSGDEDVWGLDGDGRVRRLVGTDWWVEPAEVTGVAIASRRKGRTMVLGPEGGWLFADDCWARVATDEVLPIGAGDELAWVADDAVTWIHGDGAYTLGFEEIAPGER